MTLTQASVISGEVHSSDAGQGGSDWQVWTAGAYCVAAAGRDWHDRLVTVMIITTTTSSSSSSSSSSLLTCCCLLELRTSALCRLWGC